MSRKEPSLSYQEGKWQLPPLDGKNASTIYTDKSCLQKQLSEQTPSSCNGQRERNPFLRSATIPLCPQGKLSRTKKINHQRKVTHVENPPTRPPGSMYRTVLPPIGEKLPKYNGECSPQPIAWKDGTSCKKSLEEEDPITLSKEPKLRRKVRNVFEDRGVRYMEEIIISTDETVKRALDDNAKYRETDSENDDDLHAIKSELQFVEWSGELRLFLESKFCVRRGATCTELDRSLVYVPNELRDMILCQTMDELLLW